jgi:protein TonB
MLTRIRRLVAPLFLVGVIAGPVESQPPAPATTNGAQTNFALVKVAPRVMARYLIHEVRPPFPNGNLSGTVAFRVTISNTGDVIKIDPTFGPMKLRIEVMDAVKQWKYKPYLVNGAPANVDTNITVTIDGGTMVPQSSQYSGV